MRIFEPIQSMNNVVETGSKIVGCIWDPIGKYICWLNITNEVKVYNINSRSVEFSIKLNLSNERGLHSMSAKEERNMAFSPDLQYLLVPSLDDKRMPFVCALKRSQNFQVEYVFAGPFTSVTCVRFMPAIFQSNQM
jgi:hypothetical protein